MRHHMRMMNVARMSSELKAQVVDVQQGAALRNLRQVLARIMRGELGMRLEMWRAALRVASRTSHSEMRAILEERMQSQAQGLRVALLRLPAVVSTIARAGDELEGNVETAGCAADFTSTSNSILSAFLSDSGSTPSPTSPSSRRASSSAI